MGIVDDIKKNRPSTSTYKNTKGRRWVTMLIEYDFLTGEAEILRSFSSDASESLIKEKQKQSKKKYSNPINIKKKDKKETKDLFET